MPMVDCLSLHVIGTRVGQGDQWKQLGKTIHIITIGVTSHGDDGSMVMGEYGERQVLVYVGTVPWFVA